MEGTGIRERGGGTYGPVLAAVVVQHGHMGKRSESAGGVVNELLRRPRGDSSANSRTASDSKVRVDLLERCQANSSWT